jgi:quercetin dioxygenase-like cupin family protein
MRVVVCTLLLFLFVGSSLTPTQGQDKATFVQSSTNKFMNFPAIPKCTLGAVVSGDPTKGAGVLQLKAAPGCVIPWHWHTAGENLMFVSGSAKVEMKDGAPVTLRAGDFLSLPSKHVHQFTCVASCKLFLAIDGAFDIHYVDASGKEISPDEALNAKAKTPAKKAPAKKEMKDMKM